MNFVAVPILILTIYFLGRGWWQVLNWKLGPSSFAMAEVLVVGWFVIAFVSQVLYPLFGYERLLSVTVLMGGLGYVPGIFFKRRRNLWFESRKAVGQLLTLIIIGVTICAVPLTIGRYAHQVSIEHLSNVSTIRQLGDGRSLNELENEIQKLNNWNPESLKTNSSAVYSMPSFDHQVATEFIVKAKRWASVGVVIAITRILKPLHLEIDDTMNVLFAVALITCMFLLIGNAQRHFSWTLLLVLAAYGLSAVFQIPYREAFLAQLIGQIFAVGFICHLWRDSHLMVTLNLLGAFIIQIDMAIALSVVLIVYNIATWSASPQYDRDPKRLGTLWMPIGSAVGFILLTPNLIIDYLAVRSSQISLNGFAFPTDLTPIEVLAGTPFYLPHRAIDAALSNSVLLSQVSRLLLWGISLLFVLICLSCNSVSRRQQQLVSSCILTIGTITFFQSELTSNYLIVKMMSYFSAVFALLAITCLNVSSKRRQMMAFWPFVVTVIVVFGVNTYEQVSNVDRYFYVDSSKALSDKTLNKIASADLVIITAAPQTISSLVEHVDIRWLDRHQTETTSVATANQNVELVWFYHAESSQEARCVQNLMKNNVVSEDHDQILLIEINTNNGELLQRTSVRQLISSTLLIAPEGLTPDLRLRGCQSAEHPRNTTTISISDRRADPS